MRQRVKRLRDTLNDLTHARWRVHRPLSVLEDGCADEPLVIRKAEALALMLREMPINIQEDELIVGHRTMFGPPRDVDRSGMFKMQSGVMGLSFYPKYAEDEEEEEAGYHQGGVSSHTVAGYHQVLQLGLGGFKEKARRRLAEIDDEERIDFLRAVLITLDGASHLIHRYTELAREMARGEKDKIRRQELQRIAEICEHVEEGVPRSFYEALQLFWFTRIIVLCESYSCMPLGRFDQYIGSFLERDLENGVIDEDEALELLECTFIKMNEDVDLSTADDCQRMMLSGVDRDGNDASNRATYLVLKACEELRLLDPKVGVRLHRNSPPELLSRCAELITGKLNGLPTVYNDEAIIPILVDRAGIPLEDARNYCNDGCSEIQLAGNSDFYPTWTSVHFLRLLHDMLSEDGNYATFEGLLTEYKDRVVQAVRCEVESGNRREQAMARISPVPFLSATLDGCIEKGVDKTIGGADYNFTGCLGMELPNAANALESIKQVVFEERKCSLDELRGILAANFQGHEPMRQYLINRVPKYGNDREGIDALLAEVAECFVEEGIRHRNTRGGRYLPGFFDFFNFVLGAKSIGATPDGRLAGAPTAGHLSPANGTDKSGATANLKSFGRVCTLSRPPLGAMLNVKFHSSAVAGDEGREKLIGFLKAFLELGCIAEQTNVVDAETLRDAQRNPEQYKDLMVRVWGFSAYFVQLSKDFQEEVIARTEHLE